MARAAENITQSASSKEEMAYFKKMRGAGRTPLKINIKDSLTGLIGGLISISILAFLTFSTSAPWLMAPFGASCVLAFGVWNAPLSQPRNIIGGHLISTFVGLVIYSFLGNSPLSLGLGVGLACYCLYDAY